MDPVLDCVGGLLRAPELPALVEAIATAPRILVTTHRNPDGDAIGSAIAMILALEAMNKEVYGYCAGPLLAHFLDFPHIDKLHHTLPTQHPFDMTIVLDCGELERVAEDFSPAGYTINIDHHQTNPLYGDLNWVDPRAAATGEMVFALLHTLGAQMTAGIAHALYLAIVTDTGSFRYANTRAETFHLAGHLMNVGAEPDEAARLYWDNNSPESMRLRGEALARMQLAADGGIAWSQLTAAQLATHGGPVNEPEGLSSQLRGIRGVEVGVLFTEVQGEGVRISFRSHGRLDVAAVARQFAGGGHRAAAGAFVRAELEALRPRVLDALAHALREMNQQGISS